MNVTIIIPAYNAEKTLAETLESVLSQTCATWEAIVVDDGSTDATPDIARDFVKRDARIRTITQRNSGESAARNAGLANARHDWILFLDADDRILPTYLERMTDGLAADPSLDAIICGSARIAGDGTLLIEPYLPPAGDLFAVLARRAAFPIHTCLVRRSLIESVGNFDTSLRTSPDWDLWQRIARTGARFGTIPDVLALYRMSPNGASMNAHQILKDGLRVLRQGHAPDPRVTQPHPDHANGQPPEQVRTQVFYLLSWCAGVLLGRGEDACPLLDYVREETFPELYPEAVAQCIFDSANLPSCRAPYAWEQLWPTIHNQTMKFLSALEVAAMAPNLARRASSNLKKMILTQSMAWQPLIEGLDEIKKLVTEECASWQRTADERSRTIEHQRSTLREQEQTIEHQRSTLREQEQTIENHQSTLREQEQTIEHHRSIIREFEETNKRLTELLCQSKRLTGEQETLLNDIYQQVWVRLGRRLRLMQDPRMTAIPDHVREPGHD